MKMITNKRIIKRIMTFKRPNQQNFPTILCNEYKRTLLRSNIQIQGEGLKNGCLCFLKITKSINILMLNWHYVFVPYVA